MKLRVLGCYGAQLPQHRLTSFLLDDNLLLDAGGVTSSLTLEEQANIKSILISHSHLDHMKDIFFLADNLYSLETVSVNIYAPEQILDAIEKYISNNIIWPDFTKLKAKDLPPLNLKTITTDIDSKINDYNKQIDDITDLPATLVSEVLFYHVAEGRRSSNSVVPVTGEKTVETLLGGIFSVNTAGVITATGNAANIILADISASNGIIHVIDSVLLPIE